MLYNSSNFPSKGFGYGFTGLITKGIGGTGSIGWSHETIAFLSDLWMF